MTNKNAGPRFLLHGLAASFMALVACATSGNDPKPSEPYHSATGTWASPRGVVHLLEEGTGISGEYVCVGTLTGKIDGGVANINWVSPDGDGKALWKIETDGRLTGTWTYGPEGTEGGAWDLVPRNALEPGNVTGSYESDFGPVHLEQEGQILGGTYECPGGSIKGVRNGNEIQHAWQGSDSMGHGSWRLSEDGEELSGRWGFGPSGTEGGEWNLKRQAASKPNLEHAKPARPSDNLMHSGKLLRKIIQRHDSFRGCVNEAIETGEKYPSRVNITLVIENSGQVSAVGIDPVTKGRRFEICLHEELAAWSFLPFEGDSWSRTFPYVFAAETPSLSD
jgi:hypothetical protein